MRLLRGLFAVVLLGGLVAGIAPPAGASPDIYRVQADTFPPGQEPWEFTQFFPSGGLAVHEGDLVDANFSGFGFHTATFIPSAHPNAWRSVWQAPGGPFGVEVRDNVLGGDDNEIVFNPVAVADRHKCGKAASSPCTFNGVEPLNAGGHGSGQSFFVRIAAPPGQYSLLCLLHAHMQIPLTVEASGASIPSPSAVDAQAKKDIVNAKDVDGPAADAQAQAVNRTPLQGGRRLVTIHAGGSARGVSAIEFNDNGLTLHVGDRLHVVGTNEIHTASFPISSFRSTPGFIVQCERPGPDVVFPKKCDPTKLEFLLSTQLVQPTPSLLLRDPSKFVNSGLLHAPNGLGFLNERAQTTFVARVPGTYSMICHIHGPIMSTTVTVRP
jgi:plastocyanin